MRFPSAQLLGANAESSRSVSGSYFRTALLPSHAPLYRKPLPLTTYTFPAVSVDGPEGCHRPTPGSKPSR